MPDPEQLARQEIDALLGPCGWVVQDKSAVNLAASRGVAVCELTFKTGEPTTRCSSMAKPSARSRPNRRPFAYRRRGAVREVREGRAFGFPPGARRCRSATSPPAPKPASPTVSIPCRAAATSSRFTALKHCSRGWKSSCATSR